MKRYLFALLALGILLPAGLALKAQENNEDKLDALIDSLRRAIKDAESGGTAKPIRFETRSYDVRGLVTPIRDFPSDASNLKPSGGFGFGYSDESEEAMPYFEIEAIADLIRDTVAPASWDQLSSVDIWTSNGLILVRHTAAVQDRIARMLEELAKKGARQVVMNVGVVRISDKALRGTLGAGGAFVLGREAKLRLGKALSDGTAEMIREGRIACSNTQRVALQDMNSVSYVQDYDVEIAQGSSIPDPIVSIYREGFLFDVRPIVAIDGQTVLLEVRSSVTAGRSPLDSIVTPNGEIETPVLDITRVNTTLAVPFGETAVVGGALSDGGDPSSVLIVVTPRAIRPGK